MIALDLNLDFGLEHVAPNQNFGFSDSGTFHIDSDMIPLVKDMTSEDDFYIGDISLRELSAAPR